MEGWPQAVVLPKGRRLAYAEYGAPQGEPLLYCHGFPGCRLEGGLLHEAALALGLRVVAPDRPGYGESDPQPDRRLLDWPADLAALADALGFGHFLLMGTSGGGPFALAGAAALSERVRALALVAPLGQVSTPALLEAMHQPARLVLGTAKSRPRLAEGFVRHILARAYRRHTEQVWRLQRRIVRAADAEVLSRPGPHATFCRTISESVHRGPEGLLEDLRIYVAPWGFDPAAIDLPVTLWHGDQDVTVPCEHSLWLAHRLPRVTTEFPTEEGHFTLPMLRGRAILERMLSAATR